jgi:cystathionine gamma-synthase
VATERPIRGGASTQAVHGGEPRTKEANAIATPIIQSATYTFANTQEIADHFEGRIEREEYGRYGNPTQRVAERKLAALEGAEDGLLFASGMAAITTTLFAMLSKGAHVVVTDDANSCIRSCAATASRCRLCRLATTSAWRKPSARRRG